MYKWLTLSLVIIILDQLTKYYAASELVLYQPVSVMPGFNLTLMHNYGAAFSFLSQAGGWQRWFFIILTSAVSIGILIWMYTLPRDRRWLLVALALVLGGAIGNLWDRIYFGYVIDFIDVSLPFLPWKIFNPWPTFNIADSAISIGAVMLIIDAIWFQETENET